LAPSPETSPSHSASNTRVLGNTTVPTDDWLRLNQERDDLRAEVERLNQTLDMVAEEREAWKAEVERLRDIAWKHGNRADEAEAEVERLRAALEKIAHVSIDWGTYPSTSALLAMGHVSIDWAIQTANEALGQR
jgi:seryl-tRNA synthetase